MVDDVLFSIIRLDLDVIMVCSDFSQHGFDHVRLHGCATTALFFVKDQLAVIEVGPWMLSSQNG